MQAFEAQSRTALATADGLLVTQFRCWMAGYSTRDISCWEIAWLNLVDVAGPEGAGALYGQFQGFVRTLIEEARRDIGWRPVACCRLCADERAVLGLLGASQQGRAADEGCLAVTVLGHRDATVLLRASRSLGNGLAACGLALADSEPPEAPAAAILARRHLH